MRFARAQGSTPEASHPARCHLYDPQFNTTKVAAQPLVTRPSRIGTNTDGDSGSAAQTGQQGSRALVEVRGLTKDFPVRGSILTRAQYQRAVDDVNFSIPRGRTLALVGESGSGKSTVGLMILDLLDPTGGEILLDGRPVSARRGPDRFALRRQMQIVFQDPYASLNARMTVREMLHEALGVHSIGTKGEDRENRAGALLEDVGLSRSALDRYPHQFSGANGNASLLPAHCRSTRNSSYSMSRPAR